MASHDFRLQSLDVLNRYISFIQKEQEELFKHMNLILNYNRQIEGNQEWSDKLHHQFTEEHIVDIQRRMNETILSYDLAIEALKRLKNQYAAIM